MNPLPESPPPLKTSATVPPIDLNPRRDPPLDFPDREFGQLTPADYAELGFLSGLEVHQQLLTGRKLFCRCPAGVKMREVDAEVLRHMRPTLSELGEYDGCALMEFKTRKNIRYLLARTCVCTYELDDTPPFEIDEEAVRISLEVARLFGLSLVGELHVMRKQYLDGSIPTGFQRTAMVGLGGTIPFRTSELGPGRQLRIRQLSLEEDSCREVSNIGHHITFRADRLGTPLTETVTEPEILTPRDVAAAVELIASVARATGKVRRGAGAARQDVNVSIAGSRRVEIKGVSRARLVPLLVHNEALRHLNLLRIRAQLLARGVTGEMLAIPAKGLPWETSPLVIDASAAVRRSDYAPIRDALARGDSVCAVKLPGFGGLLAHRTQPGIPFAQEIAERVRVIACLTARPFMITTSVEDYWLDAVTWKHLRGALQAQDEDAIVVVWGPREDAATATREVLLRGIDALAGVPSETRQAHPDGSTGFERILPGPERMYPDTDTPPLPVEDAWLEAIRLPERPWDREDRYAGAGLSSSAAARLATSPWADLFDALEPSRPETCRRLAGALERRLPAWWRDSGTQGLPPATRLRPLVAACDAGQLLPAALESAVDAILRDPAATPEELLAHHAPAADAATELAPLLAEIVARRPPGAGDVATLRWAMGHVYRQVPRGRIEPRALRDRVIAALRLEVPHE